MGCGSSRASPSQDLFEAAAKDWPLDEQLKGADVARVKALLAKGAGADFRGAGGRTALHAAADRIGNEQILEALLGARGADVNAVDGEGETPLHIAARSGDADCVGVLLGAGAALQARSKVFTTRTGGYTPLHIAAMEGRDECVAALLEAGAEVDARSEEKRTPLHCAARHKAPGVVSALLAAGADAGAKGYLDGTPLHDAAVGGDEACVQALLAAGADVTARDLDKDERVTGKTPRYVAKESCNMRAAELLKLPEGVPDPSPPEPRRDGDSDDERWEVITR